MKRVMIIVNDACNTLEAPIRSGCRLKTLPSRGDSGFRTAVRTRREAIRSTAGPVMAWLGPLSGGLRTGGRRSGLEPRGVQPESYRT